MEGVSLTKGAIATVSEEPAEGLKPVLQVYELRAVSTHQSGTERFRMLLSDGVHSQQAMLATQMNPLVKSGALQKGSIVQLNEFICNIIQGRRIIIVINLEVLVSKSDMIGEPKLYDTGSATSQSRGPATSQSRGPVPVQSSGLNQPGIAAANAHSYSASHSAGPKTESVATTTSYGGLSTSGPNSGRNMSHLNAQHVKSEQGAGFANVQPSSGNQNQRFSSTGFAGGYHPPNNTYAQSGQPIYQQPPPMYMNRGPIAKNEAPARIIPIAALNPYQGRWTIKARVTAKAELRRYNNPRGEGKVFSFDLLDSDGGEIRVTCFNMVAEQFYDQIEVGKVYLISKGSLKPAQKTYNHLNNEYEIFLESTSTIQPCLEEDNTIPRQQFNFRQVSEIEGMENNSMVDLIGIVSSISPASNIMRKNGTETQKRALQLKDMSGKSVEITLWGNFCNTEGQQLQAMCDSGMFPVLAIKTGRVNDFSGKSVGTISSSQIFIDPDFPEAQRIKEWYNREGKNLAVLSISRDTSVMGRTDIRKSVTQIKDEGLGRSEKPDWITVKATVTFIKVDNFCYTACPLMVGDRQCNKKVNNNGDGSWHCDRCDQTFPECDYRYLLQFQIQDHTGMTWVTAFQECGEEIIGVSAKELYLLKCEEQDEIKFAEVIRKVLFNQYIFKLKVKEETFSDEQRVKSTVIKAEKVNPSSESRYLLGLIEKLSAENTNAVPGIAGNFVPSSGIPKGGYGNMEFKSVAHSLGNNFGGNIGVDQWTEPANPLGQHVNEYGSTVNHTIGTRGGQLFCTNCSSTGHIFQNCPRNINSSGQSFGGSYVNRSSHVAVDGGSAPNICYKCRQPGHWARDCPESNAVSSAFASGSVPGRYTRQYA